MIYRLAIQPSIFLGAFQTNSQTSLHVLRKTSGTIVPSHWERPVSPPASVLHSGCAMDHLESFQTAGIPTRESM